MILHLKPKIISFMAKTCTAQKMKSFIKDFFSKCDQIRSSIFNEKLQFLASYSLLKLIFNTRFSIFSLLFSLYINIVANKRIRNTHFNIFYRNIFLLTNVK